MTTDEKQDYWGALIFLAVFAAIVACLPEGVRNTFLTGAAVAFIGGLTRRLSKRRR